MQWVETAVTAAIPDNELEYVMILENDPGSSKPSTVIVCKLSWLNVVSPMPWCMLQYIVKGGIPPTPSGSIVYSLLEAEASFALTPEQVLGYSDLQNEKVRQNRGSVTFRPIQIC